MIGHPVKHVLGGQAAAHGLGVTARSGQSQIAGSVFGGCHGAPAGALAGLEKAKRRLI
jgi:hypothetical protein